MNDIASRDTVSVNVNRSNSERINRPTGWFDVFAALRQCGATVVHVYALYTRVRVKVSR